MSSSDWLKLLVPIVVGFISGIIGAGVGFLAIWTRWTVTVTNWRRDVIELQESDKATDDRLDQMDSELKKAIVDLHVIKSRIPVI